MKFTSKAAVLAFISLTLMSLSQAQTKKTVAPAPAPKAAPAAAPRQSSAPARQSSAPARQSSAPARSAPSRQSSSTPRQSSGSSASRQTTSRQTSRQTTSRQSKSRTQSSSSQTDSGSAPQTASQRRQAQAEQRKAQASQRKQQATQAKQQRQQQQQQRKEQARQAKEQQKQQRQKEKDQARQAKEQQKQERQKQKELARQQKGQKPVQNAASSAPKSAPQAQAAAKAQVYSAPPSSAIAGKTSTGATTLNRGGSQAVVQQVNASRSNMKGINQKPLPAGDVTVHPNGRLSINAAGGRQYGVRANGTVSSYHDSTKSVTFNGNGRVSSLHTANMDIQRGPTGQRTIVSHLANNTTVVSTGRHSGYVERNVVIGNRTYVKRTIVVNQRVTTRMYVGYPYGGIVLNRYVAPVYFAPGFYGWTYDAWGNPVPYGWGWMGDPWYMGPNPYFAAYPGYPGAAFWLTDYMIGQTLSAAYQAQADAALDSNDAEYSADASAQGADDAAQSDMLQAEANTPVTPEIKNQIAVEVKQEIADDKAASAAPEQETSNDEVASVLSRANYIFVVASNLDVITSEEQSCGLRPGDTLQLTSPAGSGATAVELRVASSKRQDCPAGVMVSVSVQDLQEMLNSFHAQVESGLETLQAKQGQGGLPSAPPDALAAPRKTVADAAPVAASDVTATLEAQRQQANQTEAQAAASAFGQ
jgi:hypothetical protein